MIFSKIKFILKSKIAQNGIWLILLQSFNTIVPLLTLPYVTRILSASTYGQFSTALNWVGYFQVIVEYGFGLTGARRVTMRKTDQELDEIHSNIIVSRLLLMILCFVIFILVICLSQTSDIQIICMTIMFLMVVATVFQQTYLFQGLAEMQNIAVINMISRAISVILIFFLVKEPSDLYLYCFLYVSNYLIASIAGCFIVRIKYKVHFKLPRLDSIVNNIKEGWYLFVSSAMTKIFGSIGITILGFVATDRAVGVYSAINKIPYVLTLFFSAISQVIYPYNCRAFAESYKNGVKNVLKTGKIVVAFFAIVGGALVILNYPIVKITFGKEYASSSTLLIPFVIWVLFGILNNFLGIQTLVASGHQKEYSRSFTVSVLIMLFLMFILGKFFKAYGIAMASMLSEMSLTALLCWQIKNGKRNED